MNTAIPDPIKASGHVSISAVIHIVFAIDTSIKKKRPDKDIGSNVKLPWAILNYMIIHIYKS